MKRDTRYNRPSRGGQHSSPPRPVMEPRPEPKPKAKPVSMDIELPSAITIRELADLMQRSPIELIKELMSAGVMANINQQIDYDTAAIVAEEMGYHVVEQAVPEPAVEAQPEATPVATRKRREYADDEIKQLRPRPPVVTILGHVDHGKTSLLDVIRRTAVQASEAGGITQHIGAYQVDVNGQRITFLDTPGHEAFTAMRARGASVTDIAVLVVAADDGVQPQTREAIDHARAAQVPIIVALNKMDLASANPDYVKQQLSDLGLVPEDWGGETICVPVSARSKLGISTLLDNILVVAEMADLKANPRRTPEGVVVEGRLDRTRGATATLLIQEGTLQAGDSIVVGTSYGKIRAMFDYTGAALDKAGPSTPVVVIGLRDVPGAGDTFTTVETERKAREIAEKRAEELHLKSARTTAKLSLEDVYTQAQAGKVHSLNLILKADVQGSLEPIRNSLRQIEVKDLSVTFVHEGVGNIAESDVMLAMASSAVIIGFSVGVDPSAERLAEAEGIDIRIYDIIYRVIEDVEKALTGMLEPEYHDVLQGRAIVRQVYNITKVGLVAGSQITEGRGLRSATARVMRAGKQIHQGRVSSLRRFTDDVREVTTGLECGIGVDGANDIQVDDVIEFYTREQI
jgi:translation initiation factor IF-2